VREARALGRPAVRPSARGLWLDARADRRHPRTDFRSHRLIVYAIVVYDAVGAVTAADPVILRVIGICGALSAAVFVPSILIEHTGRTVDNRIMLWAGAVSFGLAGAIAVWRTRRVRIAVCASTLSAMIGSLAFVIAVLGSYCLLQGSALQDRFFRTEGSLTIGGLRVSGRYSPSANTKSA
jgi:hypothetical protein